jgi:hypothetical protein
VVAEARGGVRRWKSSHRRAERWISASSGRGTLLSRLGFEGGCSGELC